MLINTPTAIEAKLRELVGKPVNLENDASHQMENNRQVRINVNGTLEAPDDEDGLYYVRVKECYMGCSGVSFTVQHVLEIWKQVYDHKILLK